MPIPRQNAKRRVPRFMLGRRAITLVAAMGLLLGIFSGPTASNAATRRAQMVGRLAPNFSRVDLSHKKVSLSSYRGKVVLLNFWATWCAPCLVEVPRFAEWQKELGGEGFQALGISMDDSAAPVRTAYEKYKMNYPVVMGDAKLGELYGGVFGLPVTFLIDRKGTVRFRHQGAVHLDTLHHEVEELLREP